jgi:hypothetical protein
MMGLLSSFLSLSLFLFMDKSYCTHEHRVRATMCVCSPLIGGTFRFTGTLSSLQSIAGSHTHTQRSDGTNWVTVLQCCRCCSSPTPDCVRVIHSKWMPKLVKWT